jgi:hypothetical protein
MATLTDTTDATHITDWRLWWFARLESALARGDYGAARKAIKHLERLGIEVRFTLPPDSEEVRCDG